MEIPGLASKAIGFGTSPQNRKKYNGIEFDSDLDLNIDEAFYRNLDPATGRFWQVDPKIDGYENISPYASMYNNPVRNSDPLGDEADDDCCKEVWDGVKTGAKVALGLGSAGVVGTVDNVFGTNIRKTVAENINDPIVGQAWNVGLNVTDAADILGGGLEGATGTGTMEGSVAITGGTGGLSIEVTGLTFGLGAALSAHGALVINNASKNLISQNGRVNIQGSGDGRGKNNRTPDPKATGDHTVSDDRGSTTYEKNDNNPSGFQEVKRVDTKGNSHGGIPTPHVHENKKVRPATPDDIPKTDLKKNGTP